ncbi:MAG TPA: TfoX/Sxy family protein [Euzebyales bacterium]|nr:TfoX/Sxy family protein [Euzebyales bacterium]
MTYDIHLAARIRLALHGVADVTERSMFGGLAFLVREYMAVVASERGRMMTRADPSMSAEPRSSTGGPISDGERTSRRGAQRRDGDLRSAPTRCRAGDERVVPAAARA